MNVLADPATASVPLGPNGNRLPRAKTIRYNPSPAELQELTSRMPQARRTSFGNYNVQTGVTSRSAGSTYVVTDDPSEHRPEGRSTAPSTSAVCEAPGRVHRRPGDARHRRLHRQRPGVPRPGAPVHRGGERQHRRHAAAALLRPGRRPRAETSQPGAHGHLHAQPRCAEGYPDDRADRRRPRGRRHARLQLATTSASRRRAACGCGTSSSTSAAACRCTPAAR